MAIFRCEIAKKKLFTNNSYDKLYSIHENPVAHGELLNTHNIKSF